MQVEDTIKCTKATAHFRGSTGPDTVQQVMPCVITK